MKSRLNLATKPFETHRKFYLGAGISGAFAGLLFLGLGFHAYRISRADREVRRKTAEIERQMESYRKQRKELEEFFSRPENAKLHDRAAYLNSLVDARSFNWTQMFVDMEHLLPPGVRVVSIAPKQESGRAILKLNVAASSDEAKLKFLRGLEHSREFSKVQLISEHPPGGNASGDQTVMELSVLYARI